MIKKRTVHPDERLSYNDWAKHIRKELHLTEKKLGGLGWDKQKK